MMSVDMAGGGVENVDDLGVLSLWLDEAGGGHEEPLSVKADKAIWVEKERVDQLFDVLKHHHNKMEIYILINCKNYQKKGSWINWYNSFNLIQLLSGKIEELSEVLTFVIGFLLAGNNVGWRR